jgi:hypothetical protein
MNPLQKMVTVNRKPTLTIEINSKAFRKEIENGEPPTPMVSTCSTLATIKGK